MNYISSELIKSLREKNGMTQKQLADRLSVSDKTVSKWETGRGLPDISMIEPLARELRVSVTELFLGKFTENTNRSANMKKVKFYVCPMCRNVIMSSGEGSFSCCGINLPSLEAEAADGEHEISAVCDDGELYVKINHPMEKSHYISFIAAVSESVVQFAKLYPEQAAEARFRLSGVCRVYAYCNKHGLFV